MDTTTSSNGSTAAEREREAEQKVIVNRFIQYDNVTVCMPSTPAPNPSQAPLMLLLSLASLQNKTVTPLPRIGLEGDATVPSTRRGRVKSAIGACAASSVDERESGRVGEVGVLTCAEVRLRLATEIAGDAPARFNTMAPASNAQAKRKRDVKYETKDWKWLLWKSDVAHEKIHPKLGAGWTAVLKEACCVRAWQDSDTVEWMRVRENEDWYLYSGSDEDEDEDAIADRKCTHEWLREYCLRLTVKNVAVLTVPLLEWCVRREYKPDAETFHATARGGDMDAVKWLHKKECPWNVRTCKGAAEGGHLDVLKWLRENGCPWNSVTCSFAAEGGHLDVLKYTHENGCPWDWRTCWYAAQGGHLDVLKYAHENGCPWKILTCWGAARGGHLAVLKYAHENGCPWDEKTCADAAEGGHLDVLKYAHENGCPWDEKTCWSAAWKRHLDVLKYAHKNGCPWNEETCRTAAQHGYLDILKYAHENGCPWNNFTCSHAALFGHLDVLKYARRNGCPWDKEQCWSYCTSKDVEMLSWIESQIM